MSNAAAPQGRIGNTAFVDFTGLSKPEDLAGITEIYNTAAVLVPEALAPAVAQIPLKNVGQVVYIPDGKKVVVRAGMTQLSGDVLENRNGDPNDIMVLIGQTEITSVPVRVGYELIVIGMLVAPEAARDRITPAMRNVAGQTLFYRGSGLRMFLSEVSLDREYFDFLPEQNALAVIGEVTIESDVTKEALQQKVSDIIVLGEIRIPRHLRSLVQALARVQFGSITVYETDTAPAQ